MVRAAVLVPRACARRSEYSDEQRSVPRPFRGKYLFVYPFVKRREWYALDPDERWRMMQEHIKVGKEYPSVDNHTTYCFGLDDQEFVVAFDTDDAGAFLDLVQRLRTTEASACTERDTPSFTCLRTSLERALNALDGDSRCPAPTRSAASWREPRPGAGTAAPVAFDPQEALAHLRAADPVMRRPARRDDAPSFEPDATRDHGRPLRRARALDRRPAAVDDGRARDLGRGCSSASTAARRRPQEILDDEPEQLRAAVGLSRAKVGFLRSLAEHVTSGELDLDHVATLSDEELIAELTAVKGIGEWSAHMFLMFQLERPDVLATGDLGVRTRRRARLRARRAALRRRADGDRRAVAPVPQRRLPRAVVVARQRARPEPRARSVRSVAERLEADPPAAAQLVALDAAAAEVGDRAPAAADDPVAEVRVDAVRARRRW